MKIRTQFILLLLAIGTTVFAQNEQQVPPLRSQYFNAVLGVKINNQWGPVGSCRISTGSGEQWGACATGSGNVSGQAFGVIPLGTTPTSITLRSHLDDGVTLAGTITASESFQVGAAFYIPNFTLSNTNAVAGQSGIGNNTTMGANNTVFGSGGAGQNLFSSTPGAQGSTWWGSNDSIYGNQAGKSITSAADVDAFGYQAAQNLQGGKSTGCTIFGSAEEDGIVAAFGENAAVSLNTPTSGSCEISSAFFGQKAGGPLLTSFDDVFLGVHTGTAGAGVTHSTNSTAVGAWAAGGAAAVTLFDDTFVGTDSGGFAGAGGTFNHDTCVGFNCLNELNGTSANQADWNTAAGDSSGCSVTTGRLNTFVGAESGGWAGNCGAFSITGSGNIAVGQQSLYTQGASVSGNSNVIVGNAFATNPIVTSGSSNVIVGPAHHNVGAEVGGVMVGVGDTIGTGSSSETQNVIVGYTSSTGSGDSNDIVIGHNTTSSNGGNGAIAIGNQANASNNATVAIGVQAAASGANSVAIGTSAAASGSNTIELGNGSCSGSTVCVYGHQIADFSGNLFAPGYRTITNCNSSASPAVCSAAPAGTVVVAAAATTVVVDTTAVTGNSEILISFDSSLGAHLGVTCNTTFVNAWITARTAATSFTITVASAPTTNPACFSYSIIN